MVRDARNLLHHSLTASPPLGLLWRAALLTMRVRISHAPTVVPANSGDPYRVKARESITLICPLGKPVHPMASDALAAAGVRKLIGAGQRGRVDVAVDAPRLLGVAEPERQADIR